LYIENSFQFSVFSSTRESNLVGEALKV